MRKIQVHLVSLALFTVMMVGAATVSARTTEFSYQGFITDNNAPANGNVDFEFRLFDVATGGTALGSLLRPNVAVTNGVFGVVLDFGVFPSANRFLEIAVRPPGGSALTTLAPRSKILSTPYSTQAKNADNAQNAVNAQNAQNATNSTNATNAINAQTAQNALQLGGVQANQFVLGNDPRLNDPRTPMPGSPSYIQNGTNQQAASNFNVGGNGTAGGILTGNIVTATTQYNIGTVRVLSSPGSFNFFAGNGAGQSNTTGTGNSFFGFNAGIFNSTGGNNAFFGFEAGRNNNAGVNNAYFGKDAGRSNNTGNDNAFFGNDAGQINTTGGSNSFFGKGAGADNTTAAGNSFFGALAGNSNTTGANNAFFGFEAGRSNSTGNGNSFFGYEAGESNTIGIDNSFFGYHAGKDNTTGRDNSYFGQQTGISTTTGFQNSFFGLRAGSQNTSGSSNTFVGTFVGEGNLTGNDNTFIGLHAGNNNTSGDRNTVLGALTDVGSANLINATAVGYRAFVTTSNSIVLGSIANINGSFEDTNVGIGVTAPLDRLHVNGIIRVNSLGAAGSTSLCRNASLQISTCSSSLRYKINLAPFASGLNLVNQLKPITFNWKEGGMRDLGLGAEDVAAVEPLLVTYNEKGEVEGVKYDRIAVVLLNAVKEQQEQISSQFSVVSGQQLEISGLRSVVSGQQKEIEFQQRQITTLRQQIEALKMIVCQSNPTAEICKEEK